MLQVAFIRLLGVTTKSTLRCRLRGGCRRSYSPGGLLLLENGRFERAVEHDRVEGYVDVSKGPGDDDEPEGLVLKYDEEASDRDGDVHRQGGGGEGDKYSDSTVKSPDLQQTQQ